MNTCFLVLFIAKRREERRRKRDRIFSIKTYTNTRTYIPTTTTDEIIVSILRKKIKRKNFVECKDMSVTRDLGAFNKNKVANKFGIQLKNKDADKQSQRPLSPSSDKILINTDATTVAKNKTLNDSHSSSKQSNGFQSKTPEPIRKSPENSLKSKSNSGHISIPVNNERRDSLNVNVNHSTLSNSVKSNSLSPSTTNNLSTNPVKRSSLTPNDRSKSPSPSPIKRISIIKTPERSISPIPSPKPSSIPIKTEAEIEHQKDQPLYKRQLSKTLDNATSLTNKHKHQQELSTISNAR